MTLSDLREVLAKYGSAQFSLPNGRRLFLVEGRGLSFVEPDAPRSILVALEGEGAFLWDTTTAMNTFLLIENGFGLTLAPTLAGVLKGLIEPGSGDVPRLVGPTSDQMKKGD